MPWYLSCERSKHVYIYIFVNASIHKCYATICSSIWRYFSAISLNSSFVCFRPSCDDMGSWKLIKANVFPTEAKNSSSTWKDFSWPQLRGDVSWREWLWIKDAFLRLSFRIIKKWPKLPRKYVGHLLVLGLWGYWYFYVLLFFKGKQISGESLLQLQKFSKSQGRKGYFEADTRIARPEFQIEAYPPGNRQLHRYTPEN